jgi:hypothetical protein
VQPTALNALVVVDRVDSPESIRRAALDPPGPKDSGRLWRHRHFRSRPKLRSAAGALFFEFSGMSARRDPRQFIAKWRDDAVTGTIANLARSKNLQKSGKLGWSSHVTGPRSGSERDPSNECEEFQVVDV